MSADTTSSTHTPSGSHAAERIVRRPEPRNWPKRVRGKRRRKTYPWAKATLVTAVAVIASLSIMYASNAHPLQTVVGHLDSIFVIVGLAIAIAGIAAFRINRSRMAKALVAGGTALLLVLVGIGFFKVQALTNNIAAGKSIHAFKMPADPTGGRALNILVMGSDTRDCKGCQIDNQHGGGGSDTTILIHISADRTWAEGISIPRDSMVKPVPGCNPRGYDHVMWNAAYAVDYTCTIKQFIQDTGIPLSHYVIVNFASFQSMVDALGGVNVCLPGKLHDTVANIDFPAGNQRLSGLQALQYVRVRHGYLTYPDGTRELLGGGSDISRTHRQQAFIGSMVREAMSGDTMSKPSKLYSFLSAATKGLEMDPEFKNLSALTGVAGSLRSIGFNSVQFVTIPLTAYSTTPKNDGLTPIQRANRIQWAQPAAQQVWDDILHDRRLSADLTSQSINATQVPTGSPSASATPSPTGSASPSASPSGTPSKDSNKQLLKSNGLCS